MKVLLVEDSAALRERLSAMLKRLDGVNIVDVSASGAAGLQAVRDLLPDVVILDLQLADGTGIDMLEAMRKTGEQPVVIVLTNDLHAAYRHRCMKLGANYFFDKSREFAKAIAIVAILAEDWREEAP